MTNTSIFWAKVKKCKHENMSPDYCEDVYCGNQAIGCSGSETHCLDCGVYISECRCNNGNGMSGWPHKRWMNA